MNTEAHEIIRKMEKLIPEIDSINTNNHPAINNVLIIHSSRLLVLLAKEQAESAAKMERFTFWLIALTIVLVVIGGGQVALMLCGHQ